DLILQEPVLKPVDDTRQKQTGVCQEVGEQKRVDTQEDQNSAYQRTLLRPPETAKRPSYRVYVLFIVVVSAALIPRPTRKSVEGEGYNSQVRHKDERHYECQFVARVGHDQAQRPQVHPPRLVRSQEPEYRDKQQEH